MRMTPVDKVPFTDYLYLVAYTGGGFNKTPYNNLIFFEFRPCTLE